jgi:hypothetical protein
MQPFRPQSLQAAASVVALTQNRNTLTPTPTITITTATVIIIIITTTIIIVARGAQANTYPSLTGQPLHPHLHQSAATGSLHPTRLTWVAGVTTRRRILTWTRSQH